MDTSPLVRHYVSAIADAHVRTPPSLYPNLPPHFPYLVAALLRVAHTFHSNPTQVS